jgi:hypothetical protein
VIVVVSKSLLLFFFSLVYLAAAASLHSGGARLGDFRRTLRWEARADVASIKEDLQAIRTQAEGAPSAIKSLWNDMRFYLGTVKADAGEDARRAGERIPAWSKRLSRNRDPRTL